MKPSTIAIIVVAFVLTFGVIAYSVATNAPTSTPSATATPSSTTQATSNTTAVPTAANVTNPADATTASEVILKTNKGDIRLTLFADTPLAVTNFVTLGKRGYYDGIIFHRVIKGFMIQGGDPTGTGTAGESIYGQEFADEFPGTHKIVAGTLAMANAGAGTNGSQFFIVTDSAQTHLDGKHTAFGQVADDASMAIVKAISNVPVNGNDKPLEPVTITGFEIVN